MYLFLCFSLCVFLILFFRCLSIRFSLGVSPSVYLTALSLSLALSHIIQQNLTAKCQSVLSSYLISSYSQINWNSLVSLLFTSLRKSVPGPEDQRPRWRQTLRHEGLFTISHPVTISHTYITPITSNTPTILHEDYYSSFLHFVSCHWAIVWGRMLNYVTAGYCC